MKTVPVYQFTATRQGSWWALEALAVPGALSQVRRLDHAEAQMREAIAIVLDLHQDDFGLMMQIVGSAALVDLSERFAEQRRVAAAAQAEARKTLIAITTAMKSEGLTIRELGVVLGVSHQRAHQLVSVARRQPMPATKIGDRDHKAAKSNVKSKRISA